MVNITFGLIESIDDLKVGDVISWVRYGELFNEYKGKITSIKNGAVQWRKDCDSHSIYDGNTGNFGMVYVYKKVKVTKIAKKVHQNNIDKEEDGWLYLKD